MHFSTLGKTAQQAMSVNASLNTPGYIFLEESIDEYSHEIHRECRRRGTLS